MEKVGGPGDETEEAGKEESGDGAGVADDNGLGNGEFGFGEPGPYKSASVSDSPGRTSLKASSTAAAEDMVVV